MSNFMRELLALPPAASTLADQVDELHFFVVGMTMLGAAVVFFMAVVFVVKYRRRGEDVLTPRVDMPLSGEIAWIASLLTLFLVFWAIGARIYVRMSSAPAEAMEVYVTAKQWMWKFAHTDGRSSVSVLTVPVGKPVRLTMTSRDVIHSFAVPAFRIKQDVLPGRYTSVWFEATTPGTYQILCTEYCGTGHSNMWGTVVVLSAQDYDQWLEGGTPPLETAGAERLIATRPDAFLPIRGSMFEAVEAGATGRSMAEIGREVAVRHACLACHTVDGRRHIGPTWLGLFGADRVLEDGTRVVADAAYLTESMMDPKAKVVAGYAPVMPSYQGLLSAPDAAALVEFIRSLRLGRGEEPPHPPPADVVVPSEATKTTKGG